jgi:diguanylate cyclase
VRGNPLFVLYLGATAMLCVYAVALLIRRPGQSWPLIDNQLVVTFEVLVTVGCLASALGRRPGRGTSLVLGAGLLAWTLGDVALTLQSSPAAPSLADVLHLAFYPLACLALLLVLRSQLEQISPLVLLDGAVAAFGASAICTALTLPTILGAITGTTASATVDLASLIGALVLLALAVAVVVMVPRHPARFLLLAAGCVLMAVGQIIALRQSPANAFWTGTRLTDPVSLLGLLAASASVWLPAPHDDPPAPLLERKPRMGVLVVVAVASFVLIVLGNFQDVNRISLGLAEITLLAVATRRGLALREQKVLNASRQHLAVTDDLTGLANRRKLLDELEGAVGALSDESPRVGSSLALLLIDLDHFKEINDSFGHHIGDALLREIGPRIRQVVRRGDLVARLGGDEFAVLLQGANTSKAAAVAQRLSSLLEEPIDVGAASLHVGASIGVALAPDHAQTSGDLLRCADIAMYRAKNERGSFDVYEAALDDEADRLALIDDLRQAMADDLLALHYQPEVDLSSGKVITAEAFLRWPHPTLGLIPPEHLLALAQESGLIHALTAWVFEQAIADCARWWREGHQVAVAVNLLATDLLDSALPQRMSALLHAEGLGPEALVLEITEGMVMADLTRSKRVIQSLADSGITVSIDDFGTGFSSLSHLSELAVEEVKLDRTFTSRLQLGEADERDESLVRSVIDLGHALGLRVVAEGIERIGFVDVLAGLGCDSGQGFAIQAPCRAEKISFAGLTTSHPVAGTTIASID